MFSIKENSNKKKKFIKPVDHRWLMKSSKQKQKLYTKFLKHRTFANEKNYKNYKNLFEKLKLKSKKNYYSALFKKYEDNARMEWKIMKEITGKIKVLDNTFPIKIVINKKDSIKRTLLTNSIAISQM